MDVFKCMNEASKQLAKEGVAKNGQNQQQRYPFRKLDDLYNACSRIFSSCGLLITPEVLEIETIQGTSKNGGNAYHTKLKIEWTFISSNDGSQHKSITYGECIDYGDKSVNKAFVNAYKYLLIVTFCIPLEGEQDSDEVSPEAFNPAMKKPQPPKTALHQTTKKAPILPYLSESEFNTRKSGWIESISKGSTLEGLEHMLQSKGFRLSTEQRKELKGQANS